MPTPEQRTTAAGRWREDWAEKLHSPDDLVRFVDAVGCCTWRPLSGFPDFPFQDAVMGSVAPGAPDPWFWKDDLHIQKRLYYTRVFGGQPGYVSLALLPAFMATNGAVADELIFDGRMSPEARQIYHLIESEGPIATRKLKRLLTPGAKRAAGRILIELDRQFVITKTAITGRTLGTYSYVWDLVDRWAPEMLLAADKLGRRQAELVLREHLAAFGIDPESPFYQKVLGW